MLVKLDHFPRDRSEKNVWNHPDQISMDAVQSISKSSDHRRALAAGGFWIQWWHLSSVRIVFGEGWKGPETYRISCRKKSASAPKFEMTQDYLLLTEICGTLTRSTRTHVPIIQQLELVVLTPLKNICQNGNLPQINVKMKHMWNHHPELCCSLLLHIFFFTQQSWCASVRCYRVALQNPYSSLVLCFKISFQVLLIVTSSTGFLEATIGNWPKCWRNSLWNS